MKALKIIPRLLMPGLLSIFTVTCSAQTIAKKSQLKQILESKEYVFVAESAIPMTGGVIQLISPYNLTVNRETLTSELPYFGTAYSTPYESISSPLSFSSSDFKYTAVAAENGGYNITIKLNKPDDPDLINLSVSPNGYGTLRVNSVNRQPISFYGHVRARETGR